MSSWPGPQLLSQLCQFLLNAVTLTWWCYRHLLSQADQSGAAHPWLDWVIRLLFLSATCYLFLYLLLAVYLINSLTQNKHHCSSRPCLCPHRTPSGASKVWYPTSQWDRISLWGFTSLEAASVVGTCSSHTGQSACSFLLSAHTTTGVSHHIQFRVTQF